MRMEFLFIGHRGTRKNYDENTIGAFLKAMEFGANYIEFDIHKTKDNKLIIIHDSSIDRTTDGNGYVKNFTYSELKRFKTKNQYESIPLLEKVLTKFKGILKFMIELKDEGISQELLNLLGKHLLEEDYVISGRRLLGLKRIKKKNPKTKICYNITKGIGLNLRKFLELGRMENLPLKFDMISLRSNLITREFIKTCHQNKIKALAWDFIKYETPINKMTSLIQLGIDGILFDDYKNIPIVKKWVDIQ